MVGQWGSAGTSTGNDMSISSYYDPLYGHIELHPMALEMVSHNSELIRLRSIGMMNFRSLSMLPLTSITRLEHSIGIAHLVDRFSRKNRVVASRLSDFLAAALYHDINCASFGHSVEWAIDRHSDYDHEVSSEWVSIKETLSRPEDKPMFFSQDDLHRNRYDKRFGVDFDFMNGIMSGLRTCVISSAGMDLDNIDNVCRMAFYLGMLRTPDLPTLLADSLTLSDDQRQFSVTDEGLVLVEDWLRTRSAVYKEFIYSREYMGFEYLVFLLVRQYSDKYGSENVRNLFHYTDENLLFEHSVQARHGEVLAATARRLLLSDIPECYVILRSAEFNRFQEARSPKFCDDFIREVADEAVGSGIMNQDERRFLAVHVTSDNKKTQRSISIMLRNSIGVSQTTIGSDCQYILFAILGHGTMPPAKIEAIKNIGINVLHRKGINANIAGFAGDSEDPQRVLF